jgi:predicted acetylornithine/succinylornithine family transaminase
MSTTQTAVYTAIEQEQAHIAQTYRRPDFVVDHADGMTVWDADGKSYLDFVAGIAVMALGHNHPGVVKAIQEQAAQLIHVSNLYYTTAQSELAMSLCTSSFADRVFFCNSGAEANEAALKFARKYAKVTGHEKKTEIIAFTHAFHGRTMGALAVTPKAHYQDPFKPLMPGVTILPFNDLAAVKSAISDKTCAVIVEPIQGEGGIHPAESEFLQGLRKLCDQHQAVLIFDEVQCGLGRTGKLWAHEWAGVTPDIMTVAKPLASGLPIGATLMTNDIHQVIVPGDHGSTFAGGPVVCAVANVVLSEINTPAMLEHVQAMGNYLVEQLAALNSPHIKTIRGKGLIVGVELDFAATDLVERGYDAGFLLVNAGPDVLRFVPPLIVEKEHIDALMSFLADALS